MFGMIALALAAGGVYGVASSSGWRSARIASRWSGRRRVAGRLRVSRRAHPGEPRCGDLSEAFPAYGV